MTTSAIGDRQNAARGGPPGGDVRPAARPVALTGALAAATVAAIGLAVLTLLVLAGWIAAPHGGLGLTGVLRAAAALWLIGHHVGFALHGAGRIGLLPLGLVLLPGALLWRAGRWVVRSAGFARLSQVGYAALALAVPYAILAAVLALASRSSLVAPSLPQAAIAGFVLAATAGWLGGARALAPWAQLASLLSARLRSVLAGATATLAVLAAAGAVLAGASLGVHLRAYGSVSGALAPGAVGVGLLLLAQLAYLPNAVIWAVSFMLGPGFAFGSGTVVAPTGSALGTLPRFPLLAALPAGLHTAFPPWLSVGLLAVPYLAGAIGGLLLARSAPTPVLEAAPMWGFASGALAGCVLGLLAAFAGGPLGDGRLAEVGPSGWQVGTVAALEMGVAAAICAGAANWLRFRAAPRTAPRPGPRSAGAERGLRAERGPSAERGLPADYGLPGDHGGHTIYLDPWAGDEGAAEPSSSYQRPQPPVAGARRQPDPVPTPIPPSTDR